MKLSQKSLIIKVFDSITHGHFSKITRNKLCKKEFQGSNVWQFKYLEEEEKENMKTFYIYTLILLNH